MATTAILRYPAPAETGLPAEEEGKFLQIVWRGREHLLFAPAEVHRYHNQILARFLQENAIAHRWVTEEKLEVDSPDLAVTGGGRYRAEVEGKVLELYDDSQAYGRFDEGGLAERVAASGGLWSGYDIRIG
ncbi:MAG: hypothetical protein C0617_09245 [Desulfuromonas sp.]|uniref:hypothetical protein n=1 Tax=Desulfuromonas sp. TaxID=892 RepID=UPI000CB2BF0C|nr:hypothetical protein [Desulfuromonas sp.]PLX84107.1 MAG: hypothetical protein C0617_09245 [Desulfuromonas sp.]